MKIPYADIVSKIKETANISEEEINAKVKAKMDQLAGLISKEGAAHIIANELGVKLLDSISGKMKINKIISGMKSVETSGKVTNIFEARDFVRKDGGSGKVGSFVIGDETGTARIVLWNELTEKLSQIKKDDIITIKNAYVKENQNKQIELHLGSRSEMLINPAGEKIGEVSFARPQPKADRKKIEALTAGDTNVEVLGTIVQVFEPRFYEVCPECNKRLKQKEGGFYCDMHNNVTPSYAYVMNAVIDDGTATIRTVFFKNQASNLMKMQDNQILLFKDNPASFQEIKNQMLGEMVKIVGRITKNEMFDRLEFVAQLVFTDPDANEELKKLQKEAEAIQ